MKRVLAAVFACATFLLPGVAWAHTHLERSEPAAGAVLQKPPTLITLVFSEAPQLAFTTITLTAPDGSLISLGDAAKGPNDPNSIVVPVTGTLAAGVYTVTWRTAAADGHPSHGTFTFTLQTTAAATTVTRSSSNAPPQPEPAAVPAAAAGSAAGFNVNSPAFVLVRWAVFTTILLMIGVVVFRELVLLRWMRPAGTQQIESDNAMFMMAATRRAARIGAIAAIVLVLAALARFYSEAIASYGAADATTGANLQRMLLHTSWGLAWMLQMLAAIVAAFAFQRIAHRVDATNATSSSWALAIAAVLVVALTPALSGHALAAPRFATLAVIADFVHVLAGGAWLGTLFALLVAGLPATTQLPANTRTRTAAELVNTFSPLALVSAGTLVATGVIAAVIHLQHVSDLWQDSYGTMLLRKLVFVAAVIAAGAYNWLQARPALARDAGEVAASRIKRSAILELTLGTIVIAITAILVATMPPHGV